jgi:hypothetical protein
MSYYDFDDHFWQPCEVCAPPEKEVKQKGRKRSWLGVTNVFCGLWCKGIVRRDRNPKSSGNKP